MHPRFPGLQNRHVNCLVTSRSFFWTSLGQHFSWKEARSSRTCLPLDLQKEQSVFEIGSSQESVRQKTERDHTVSCSPRLQPVNARCHLFFMRPDTPGSRCQVAIRSFSSVWRWIARQLECAEDDLGDVMRDTKQDLISWDFRWSRTRSLG